MKKLAILLILLFPSLVLATNDFDDDPDVVFLYNFENGALTTDSKSTNTLTCYETPLSSSTHQQGTYSIDILGLNQAQYCDILDASLDNNVPIKGNNTDKTFSFMGWTYFHTVTSSDAYRTLIGKYDSFANKRGYLLAEFSDDTPTEKIQMLLGFNSGTQVEVITHNTTIQAGNWYFIASTYNNSNKTYKLQLKDNNCATVGTNVSGTATLDAGKLSVNTLPMAFGYARNIVGSVQYNDALQDGWVGFKRVVTDVDITNICLEAYSGTGGATTTTTVATTTTTVAPGTTTTTVAPTTTTTLLPDLIITSIDQPADPFRLGTGSGQTINSTVKNNGAGPIAQSGITGGGFVVPYFLSLDSTCTTNDIYLGFRQINYPFIAGASDTGSIQITLPVGQINPGTYWICAYVNPDPPTVPESNYLNNTKTSTTSFTVQAVTTTFDKGFNYRATVSGPTGYPGDGPDEGPFLPTDGPGTQRNIGGDTVTFGITQNGAQFNDRASPPWTPSIDHRLAGSASRGNGQFAPFGNTFSILQTGQYELHTILGSLTTDNHTCFQVLDGSNVLVNIDEIIPAGHLMDINKTDLAGDPDNETGLSKIFTNLSITIKIGCSVDDNSNSIINNFRYVLLDAVIPTTTTTTTIAPTTTTTTSTSTTTITQPASGYCGTNDFKFAKVTTDVNGAPVIGFDPGVAGFGYYAKITDSLGNVRVVDIGRTATPSAPLIHLRPQSGSEPDVMGNLPNGTYTFNATAYGPNYSESANSNPVQFLYTTSCGISPPTTTTVTTTTSTTTTTTTTTTSTTATTLVSGPNIKHHSSILLVNPPVGGLVAGSVYQVYANFENDGNDPSGTFNTQILVDGAVVVTIPPVITNASIDDGDDDGGNIYTFIAPSVPLNPFGPGHNIIVIANNVTDEANINDNYDVLFGVTIVAGTTTTTTTISTTTTTFPVTLSGPDPFVHSEPSISGGNSSVTPGIPFIAQYDAQNRGDQNTSVGATGDGSFFINILISPTQSCTDPSAINLTPQGISVPALAPLAFAPSPQQVQVNVPLGTSNGLYWLLSHVDSTLRINDANRNNNCGFKSQQITVSSSITTTTIPIGCTVVKYRDFFPRGVGPDVPTESWWSWILSYINSRGSSNPNVAC